MNRRERRWLDRVLDLAAARAGDLAHDAASAVASALHRYLDQQRSRRDLAAADRDVPVDQRSLFFPLPAATAARRFRTGKSYRQRFLWCFRSCTNRLRPKDHC
jgi:hypothetical protein